MSKPRAQLKHALLRVILPSLAKMRSLKRVHGSAGKCSVYEAYMVMSGATDAVVDRDCILSIADDNDIADPEAFIDYCLEKGLFILDSGGISSTPVIEDQEAYAERIKQNAAEAERKRRERSGGRPADSPKDNPKDVRVGGSGLPVFVSVIDSDLGSKELKDSHPELTGALETPPPGLIQAREHVWINPVSIDNWGCTHGPEVVERALDVLNGDIEGARGRPDFPKKQRTGRDGAAGALQKWCFSEAKIQLEREKGAKPKARGDPPRHNPSVQKLIDMGLE